MQTIDFQIGTYLTSTLTRINKGKYFSILSSEWSKECINFTVICPLSRSKSYLVGILFDTFLIFSTIFLSTPKNFQHKKQKPVKLSTLYFYAQFVKYSF